MERAVGEARGEGRGYNNGNHCPTVNQTDENPARSFGRQVGESIHR